MNDCAAIPIGEIQAASQYGTSLRRNPIVPHWRRKLQVLYYVPKILKYITDVLSADLLGTLTKAQAKDLYAAVQPFSVELDSIMELTKELPWPMRMFMRIVWRSTESECEKIRDIVEALAWGSDDELRGFIDSTVGKIDLQLR
jgi:hypothetical protein